MDRCEGVVWIAPEEDCVRVRTIGKNFENRRRIRPTRSYLEGNEKHVLSGKGGLLGVM